MPFLLASPQAGYAAQKSATAQTEKKELVFSSNPILLLDVDSGKVLYQRDANKKWYPASLTKLMTSYVLFRAIAAGELSEESELVISKHAASYPPAKMGFAPGTKLSVGNALKMMVVKSANDIAAALAERVAGSEAAFARRMNSEAARLGMSASHFVNANGLFSSSQTVSARDLGVLVWHIFNEFPQYSPLFRIPAIRHGKAVLRSNNNLLEHFHGTNGMKTGFVCSSGYNMVAAAKRGGRQLVAVVLGAPNAQIRGETAAYLLTEGFRRADMARGRGVFLSNGASFGPITGPRDMRPQICSNGSSPKWVPKQSYSVTYLEPRFKVMDPVRVYTGVKKRTQRLALPARLKFLPARAPRQKVVMRSYKKRGGAGQTIFVLSRLPMAKP